MGDSPKMLPRYLAEFLVSQVETAARMAKQVLPQIRRVGIHGSYLSDAEMIGDVDVVFEVDALSVSELDEFCARHPSPVARNGEKWPEVWTLRQLRVSPLVDCRSWRILRPNARVKLLSLVSRRKAVHA